MQQELIEMLEKVVDHVVFCNGHDQRFSSTTYGVDLLKEAGALIEKAKNNAPAVPQGEPAACLVRQRTLRTRAAIAHDGQDHFSEWSDWYPATLKYGTAVTDPRRNSGPEHLFEMLPLVLATPAPAPAQEVTLTDDEIFHLWDVHVAYTPDKPCKYPLTKGDILNFSRAVIAALRAKENKL